MAFKLHMKWSYAQHASTPTTTILSATAGTFYGLNCFSHMIYMLQTSVYQNIRQSVNILVHDDTDTFYLEKN